jgi:hypothetical protein
MTKINEAQAKAVRAARQAGMLDQMIGELKLKNDAALARAMETQPAAISKLRRGTLPFSALYIVAAQELMENHSAPGWDVRDIKARLGLRRVGDPK